MKKFIRARQKTLFYFLLCFFIAGSSSLFAADEKEPTLQELAQTEAAKLFVTKQYDQALVEFQRLEAQHPKSVIIKRYIASLYDSLRKWDEAVSKLKESLAIDPNDLIARQLLGDIYIKQAELELARQEFVVIQTKDIDGAFGKYASKRLEEIRRLTSMPQTEVGKRMAVQDFMKSKPAKDFAIGLYGKALAGFDELLVQYPDDLLIRRFRGIAFLREGRKDEALAAFNDALKMAPDNVALHFYLGQAYLEMKKNEEARREFQWVIAHDETSYKVRAQRAVFQTLGQAPAGGAAGKPLSISFQSSLEWDTNATYKSTDPAFTSSGDQNSVRYPLTATASYRLLQKNRWTFTGDALYSHTLYNDFPHLQTITYGGGISALYSFAFFSKPAFLNIREGATQTFLKNRFYVWSNSLSGSFIVIPHKRVRTTTTYRFTVSEYDNDGLENDFTSRDGFGNSISQQGTFYFNDKRTFYFTQGYEYERGDVTGANYVKEVHGIQEILHFPIYEKVEGDINFKYKNTDYPKYASFKDRRVDHQFTLVTQITRPITKFLTLTLTYTYDNVRARYNVFQYEKHLYAAQLTYKY